MGNLRCQKQRHPHIRAVSLRSDTTMAEGNPWTPVSALMVRQWEETRPLESGEWKLKLQNEAGPQRHSCCVRELLA